MPSTSLVIKKIKIKMAMRHKIIPVSITLFKRRERKRKASTDEGRNGALTPYWQK